MVSNYLEDPAHHDLEDLEGDSEVITQLRHRMIDLAAAGQDDHNIHRLNMTASVILNQGHSASVPMTYFFTRIANTRFSLAVVLPEFWRYVQVPEMSDASLAPPSTICCQRRRYAVAAVQHEPR